MTRTLFPEDIHNMSPKELDLLTYEIREFLLDSISKTGGHLASNLGVVELTVALHKTFDSPSDKLIWDVGHQCYVHKLLTGRAQRFGMLRQLGGISGFPRRDESIYDCFNTGHSSTSISVAAGIAAARDLKGENFHVVAVIGDGAMTGGLAYEGLNNLGASKSKVIIVLNDNEMSISASTGGLAQHLSRLRMSRTYLGLKKQVKNSLASLPLVGKGIYSGIGYIKDSLKYAIVDGAFFEELGFKYFGPVDGHSIGDLTEILSLAKDVEESVVIHVVTQKGRGYRNAENNPGRFHQTGPFDVTTGAPLTVMAPTFSEVFGEKMVKLAREDQRIIAISAAMTEGTGLSKFKEAFPERIFDVGIAEEHAVTFAAGLASQGFKPVVAVYSTFLQRAYDQIMSDVCMQKMPVVFAMDRAGNVGNDGETHHGIYDLSYLSHMPGLVVMAPKDGLELEKMLDYACSLGRPCAIRYPKGEAGGFGAAFGSGNGGFAIETAKSELLQTGSDVEIWAIGSMVKTAAQAIPAINRRGYSAGLVNARFLKPLDEAGLKASIGRAKAIVTLEDNIVTCGFGACVSEFIRSNGGSGIRLLKLGWQEQFLEHGDAEGLYRKYKLDAASVAERICGFIEGEA
ncbi:MAG: 1-deoxy-D-xylulose-5-phosphate synthase [Clostridiales bacterium]|nr:1-deoxy-D-xylulose-5-phosphate synthase [Clostridiales bacterium]